MICEVQKEDGTKVYKYKEPSIEKQFEDFVKLSDIFDDYLESQAITRDKICIDKRLINEIFIRVDKRRDYFIIFHDETYINEIRETALIAYWVLKFKPFNIASNDAVDFKININCGFAAYLVLDVVNEVHRRKTGKNISLSETYVQKLLYAFKYWDISKEAMMLIAETLCEHVMYDIKET